MTKLLFALFFTLALSARANTPPANPLPMDDTNPFLELYRLRVMQAENNLERQIAIAELAEKRLVRGKRLLASQAISMEEVDVMTSEQKVSAADKTLAGRKVEEAKAFLRIVEAQVKRGLPIPLCTYESE